MTISGGTVTATGGIGGVGIGGGSESSSDGTVTLGEKVMVVDGTIDGGYVKIAKKPTCEGGTVEEGEGGVWIVTPTNNATAVTITGLMDGAFVAVPPAVTQVTGVKDGQIKVRFDAYEITDAFTITGGAIQLNPEGEVNGVPVKPTIGDLDEGELFAVGEGCAAVTVRAIPGLKYALQRTDSLRPVEGNGPYPDWGVVGEPVVAEDATVTLKDDKPPEGAAFYRVVVSVP